MESGDATAAEFASVYPNPVADGDRGEYVVLAFPESTRIESWTLADGETTVEFGNRTVRGKVLVAADPTAARARHTDVAEFDGPNEPLPVVEATGLALSNGGETLVLRDDGGSVVAKTSYSNAPEGEVYRNDEFRPPGTTAHPAWRTRDVKVQAFVTPDSAVPLGPIRNADDRVLLAGYSFASVRVARALSRADARGVDVRVLVDDAPVGGISRRQLRTLDELAADGVTVRALGGTRARYDHHHAKYLVADDTAVVLTENWKPSGSGGQSNRGWGVVVDDAAVAADLATVFESDWAAPDARSWAAVTEEIAVDSDDTANGTYPSTLGRRNVSVESVTVVTAPDNAERVLRNELGNASERVHVLQMTAERDGVLVHEAIAAARRGVDVRVLLSSAWYAREENENVVDALNALADREDLPLEAALVDPDGRFRKVHAKGVVVDDAVVLGSINWNDHSLQENREVALVLEGEAVASYYAKAFTADWKGGGGPEVPWWLGMLAVGAVLVCLTVLRRHLDLGDGGRREETERPSR